MAVEDRAGTAWSASDADGSVDERTLRALREVMTVLEEADDLYQVVSESGRAYRVDLREPACTCPDFRYRERPCKHIRRVSLSAGAVSAQPVRMRLRAAITERRRERDRLAAAVRDLERTVDAYEEALDCLDAVQR